METEQLKYRPAVFWVPFIAILALWMVYYLNWRYFLEWNHFGIVPHTVKGLRGIVFSPFLHGSLQHLWNNTLALLVLLPLICYYYYKNWQTLIIGGILLSGFGTWLIATSGTHIGASGLIYVLTAYMFFTGIRSKQYRLMAISFLMIILYGGSVWYMLPDIEEGISWQGHLAGFISGLLLSYLLKKPQLEPQYKYDWQHPNFDESKDDFIKQFDAKGNYNPLPLLRKDPNGYVYNDTFHRKNGTHNHRIIIKSS
ncbi:rhomboid family intramembrane serine protease [Paenimyroides aestuarii]|uniref:Rhomboid family intramembrane serine protease n=1 Tax=Paenimyroides aestuarii TaxID=2968490 RepID=A0ABY5NP39_9FLAO|nr:rhomboid family intramembrane serine protease [Paenimyroides aestuarii]UUV20300.1 rhomboid family intramembrane serine protease [Paenimyroides aestuarii]